MCSHVINTNSEILLNLADYSTILCEDLLTANSQKNHLRSHSNWTYSSFRSSRKQTVLLKVKGESNRFCLRRNSASSEPSPWPMIFGNQYLSNVNMRFTMSVCLLLGGFKSTIAYSRATSISKYINLNNYFLIVEIVHDLK